MVLAVKLGMSLEEARTSVNTLSDVEGLCVKYASAHGSSSPVVAVEVLKTFLQVDYDSFLPHRPIFFSLSNHVFFPLENPAEVLA
jgi:hypothetical protein